jgi:hypothetical protein
MPTATYINAGIGYGTVAGYSIAGSQATIVVTAYKMPFATETMATQSSANLPVALSNHKSGFNGASKGYVMGGYSGSASTATHRLLFSTDTTTALAGTLSLARYLTPGVSDGVTAYAQGGSTGSLTGVSDKVVFTTDTVSDNNSGDVTAEVYNGLSFPADNGYLATRSGASNQSKKIGLATGVSANVTSTLLAEQYLAATVCDGNGLGWISGDDATPYSVSHKFTKATETYSSDAGAVLSFGKHYAAYFNNGAY